MSPQRPPLLDRVHHASSSSDACFLDADAGRVRAHHGAAAGGGYGGGHIQHSAAAGDGSVPLAPRPPPILPPSPLCRLPVSEAKSLHVAQAASSRTRRRSRRWTVCRRCRAWTGSGAASRRPWRSWPRTTPRHARQVRHAGSQARRYGFSTGWQPLVRIDVGVAGGWTYAGSGSGSQGQVRQSPRCCRRSSEFTASQLRRGH